MEIMLLVFLILLSILATFYYTGLKSARITRKWLARLANGEPIPQEQQIGWRSWLLPVHREARGIFEKMDQLRQGNAKIQDKLMELEFMQHFILGSLIEGIIVVDEKHEITLVNSEFLNLFQLQQSPLRQTVREVMGDSKLDLMINEAFRTAKVSTGRISCGQAMAGRPPSFEVSAIPARVSETRVEAVVVLFLPPPDRPRMVQILKNHTEKISRLADSWTVRGGVRLRSTVADLPDVGTDIERLSDASKQEEHRDGV